MSNSNSLNAGSAEDGVEGTQSIGRALRILKFAASRSEGVRLRDVTTQFELNKTTVHRILSALVANGFLREADRTGTYEIGREAEIIGWVGRSRQSIRSVAQQSLSRICQETGDTVFLSVRSGVESVCVDRQEGSFPIRTLTLDIGSRRPLGVGSGSLALLSAYRRDEIDELLIKTEPLLVDYPRLTLELLRRQVNETISQGYSFNDERVISGMSAVGVAVLDAEKMPVAALSVAAITARMTPERRDMIVSLLIDEVGALSRRLRQER